jgi:type II secretory pathway component GspD/PulD (secretin)
MIRIAIVVLTLGTVFSLAPANQPPAKDLQTINFVVKTGTAKAVAAALAKHFKGDAEVQVLAQSPDNCVSIRATAPIVEEAVKLLAQMERQPQVVAVEFLIAEFAVKSNKNGKRPPPPKQPDQGELTGSSKEVVAKLEQLESSGAIESLKRFQMTATENQPVSISLPETAKYVTGISSQGLGSATKRFADKKIGTQATVSAWVARDKIIDMDIDLEHHWMRLPEDGIPIGKDENGDVVCAAEFVAASFKGKVNVPADHAVVVEDLRTESFSGQARTLVIVSARILETGAKLPPILKEKGPPKGKAIKDNRTVFSLKYGNASKIAFAASQLFKGEAEIQSLPQFSDDCLLLQAKTAEMAQIEQMVDEFDRRPQRIAFEVVAAHFAALNADPKKPRPTEGMPNESDLEGPFETVLAKLEALQNKGLFDHIDRFRVTAENGQQNAFAYQPTLNYVTGATTLNRGNFLSVVHTINYRKAGASGTVKGWVMPDKEIRMELGLTMSTRQFSLPRTTIGLDESGDSSWVLEFHEPVYTGKLRVFSGNAVVAQSTVTESEFGLDRSLIIVSARILEPDMTGVKSQVFGQDTDSNNAAPMKRGVYCVAHKDAAELASALNENLRGKSEALVVPYTPANCLLFRAKPADVDDLLKAAAALDRRPQAIIFESFAAGFALSKDENGTPKPAPPELGAENFSGPLSDVAAKLETLKKKGAVEYLWRLRLAVLEDQTVGASFRASIPFVTGVTKTNANKQNRINRRINYQAINPAISVSASVGDDGRIRAKVDQKNTWIRVPEDSSIIGLDEGGQPIRGIAVAGASFSGTLEFPANRAVAAKNIKATSDGWENAGPLAKKKSMDAGLVRALMVVGARIVENPPKTGQ